VERLAELGFDDLLLTSGTNFAPEDVPQEMLAQILTLRLRDAGRRTAIIPEAPAGERHPRAQDPVCRRYIDLTTMTSPTSRQIFTKEHIGRTYYLCSQGCLDAFEREPAAYLAR
jgi:YHS domain-containing protein